MALNTPFTKSRMLNFPHYHWGFPGVSDGKESPALQETRIWSLGRRSPGEGNGNPLLYSCLENSMDKEAWEATLYGITKSQTWLSDEHFHCVNHNPLLQRDSGTRCLGTITCFFSSRSSAREKPHLRIFICIPSWCR